MMGLMAHLRQFGIVSQTARVCLIVITSLFLISVWSISVSYAHGLESADIADHHADTTTSDLQGFFFLIGAAFIGALVRISPSVRHPLFVSKLPQAEIFVVAGLAMIAVMLLSQVNLLTGLVSGYVIADFLCQVYVSSEGGDSHA